MKFHNPDFNLKHLQFLYKRALDHEKSMAQWKKHEVWHYVHEYACKLEAVVELMESIVVFHLGSGLDQSWDKPSIHGRLHSFDKFFKGVNVPTRT